MTDQLPTAQLHNAAARRFALAGDAIFTVKNSKTGGRFTFRIDSEEGRPSFVKVLTGPENTNDYTFIGSIFAGKTFKHSQKSKISADAKSVKSFDWVWAHIDALPENIEVWHEGKCGRCGRLLTTPESIATGIGPTCAQKMK